METENNKKLFILDSNVILHDSRCLLSFGKHDICVPIAVLEDLDEFKKGREEINFHARQFVRNLDELSSDKLFNGGIQIAPGLGRVSIRMDKKVHEDIAREFGAHTSANRILNTAYREMKEQSDKKIVLVSKNVNQRMKARAIGITAEDYISDHVQNPNGLYSGRREIHCPDELVNDLYGSESLLKGNCVDEQNPFVPNEFVIVRGSNTSGLAMFDRESGGLRRVHKETVYGVVPKNAEQTFAVHALLDRSKPLVSITGKAGTGKTLLALAAALEMRKHYHQILLTRPVVPLSNKDIGYLPGDIGSKLKPYMQPLFDNLGVIRGRFPENSENAKRLARMLDEEKLVIEPLAYIRGRSLVKKYMIVDEAQNLTPHEVKTIITRAGEGTKMVFTGDIYQIDHPYLDIHSNGLSTLIEKMQGQRLYAHINLEKGERSELSELATDLL